MLRAARDGSSVAAIARQLFLSEGTVRNHLSTAIGKTGAGNRAEAVLIADGQRLALSGAPRVGVVAAPRVVGVWVGCGCRLGRPLATPAGGRGGVWLLEPDRGDHWPPRRYGRGVRLTSVDAHGAAQSC